MSLRNFTFTSWLLILSIILSPIAGAEHPTNESEAASTAEQKKDPDWILMLLGNSMLATGTALFVVPLARTLTIDVIPGLIRARNMSRRMKEGDAVIADLLGARARLDELGAAYRQSANELSDHIARSPVTKARSLSPQELDELISANRLHAKYASDPATRAWLEGYTDRWLSDASPEAKRAAIASVPGPYASEIRQLSPTRMDNLVERHDQYRAIAAHPDGGTWLAEYEKRRARELAARAPLIEAFQAAMKKTENFSHSVNRLSEGFLAWQVLRTKVLSYRLEPTPYGAAGKLRIAMNGGYYTDVSELRDMGSQLHAPITDCQNLMASLARARSDNLNRSPVQFFLPLGVGGAAVGIGWALKEFGHKSHEQREKKAE